MNTAGSRLRYERTRLGKNIIEFAKIGGVGKSSQSRYEANEVMPDADYLNKISAAGARLWFILKGEVDTDDQNLSDVEHELVSNYRLCSLEIKKALEDMARNSAIHPEFASDSTPIIIDLNDID